MYLRNETRFERNGGGGSILLSSNGTVEYTLPAPPGRWLFIRQGASFSIEPGTTVDSEFPFYCPAGVVGGTSAREQSGPGCSRQCDAGSLCPPGTTRPLSCPRGYFCPQGTTREVPCDSGTFSTSSSLKAASECDICTLGHFCPPGTSEPEPCAAGRFGATPGQASRECTGPCAKGYVCTEGSTSNTSAACAAGTYNPDIGGASLAACRPSPVGSYVAITGADAPTACIPGHFQRFEGKTQCDSCPAGEHQPEPGAAACVRCSTGQHSVNGSERCTVCASGYYRPKANSSAAECTRCSAIQGISCDENTTVQTLSLDKGYWRHSTGTLETWRCPSNGDWSPCSGGADAAHDGDGYCAPGFHGPRCELCDGPHSKFFDQLEARCEDCGDVIVKTTVAACIAFMLLLAWSGITGWLERSATRTSTGGGTLCRLFQDFQRVWQSAGMRCKVKALVGFYQCIAAVPSTFDVTAPIGLEEYTRWIHLLELPSELENIFVAPACLGDYKSRILFGSSWPLVLLLLCATGSIVFEMSKHWLLRTSEEHRAASDRMRDAVRSGLQHALPPFLGLTFLVVPSTSTRIFRAFLCDAIQYSEAETRRYLHADLALSCSSTEYEETRTVAFAFMAVWPIGIPLLYAVLLWASRDAIRSGVPTSLSRATSFLSDDFKPLVFWWEPLEMCRKLALTGWVLVAAEDFEQARILLALIVSIVFFGLRLALQPLKRCVARDRFELTRRYFILMCTTAFTHGLLLHSRHTGLTTWRWRPRLS